MPPLIALPGGVLLTVVLVVLVLDSLPAASIRRHVLHALAWDVVIGGGIYGLLLFDGQALRGPFDWAALATVVFGGLVLTLIAQIYRKGVK